MYYEDEYYDEWDDDDYDYWSEWDDDDELNDEGTVQTQRLNWVIWAFSTARLAMSVV